MFSSEHEVTFVLAVLVIDDDYHPTGTKGLDRLCDAGQSGVDTRSPHPVALPARAKDRTWVASIWS